MNNIDKFYKLYHKSEQKISEFRLKGSIYRHIFSLPWRWMKTIFSRIVLSYAREKKEFPVLRQMNNLGIIISLTSFPFRIPMLHLVIKSLLNQTYLPERIIIWLSEDEFPNKMEDIPNNLKELINNGLEIRFVPDNLRSHKKYYYAFSEFSNKIVITVDDDLYYKNDTIERLINMHKVYPKCVCANVIRKIHSKENEFLPYKKWKKIVSIPLSISHEFVGIGYGGILYPPSCFDNKIFNIEAIKNKCPYADDLWLKANEINMNVKIASGGDYFAHPIILPHSQKIKLQKKNNGEINLNNNQWNELRRHFGLDNIYFKNNN